MVKPDRRKKNLKLLNKTVRLLFYMSGTIENQKSSPGFLLFRAVL